MKKCPLCKHHTLDNGGLCWACLWTFDLGSPVALTTRRNLECNKKFEPEAFTEIEISVTLV